MTEIATEASATRELTDAEIEEMKTPQDFLRYFKSIPEEKWVSGAWRGNKTACALGHLGFTAGGEYQGRESLKRARARLKQFFNGVDAPTINDGLCSSYKQPTPRHRIISALQDAVERFGAVIGA